MNLRQAAVCSAVAMAASGDLSAAQRVEGRAYNIDSGSLLYRESHWIDGSQRTVLYRCPDGKAFARKVVETGSQPAAPNFVSDDARDGYREGVRAEADGFVVFSRSNSTSSERSKAIIKSPTSVIDAGFDAYVREHWDAMDVGSTLALKFLIPSRLSYADFAIRRLDDAQIDGVDVRRYRLELSAWYAFALPRIDVAYTVDGRQLRQYQGLANIRGNDGGNLTVRIEFPPAEQADGAGGGAITNPADVALDGRCPL